ncbi:MAG: putative replication initiation protein [Circoviridae sp.]|nr:MAG: putative replication initiation protein [Circoviridae sp.]
MSEELIKSCLEKVCSANPDDKQKHLIYKKLGIKLPPVPKCPHAFITIQIDDKKLVEERRQEIGTLASLLTTFKFMKSNIYSFCIENYSKEYPNGGNLHFHYLVKQSDCILNKTKILRNVQTKYKDCIKVVNYQHSDSLEHYKNRLAYILGEKQGAEKLVFQERDCVWRAQNNIDPYYTNA